MKNKELLFLVQRTKSLIDARINLAETLTLVDKQDNEDMKKLEESVTSGSYKTLWVAGKSSEMINEIVPCVDIIERLKQETFESLAKLGDLVGD